MIEQEATKQKVVCPQCNKRMRKTEKNGVTAWILRIGSCGCTDTPADTDETVKLSSTNKANDSAGEEEPMPECIAGRYEVLEQLGKGGMGTVYKVRDKAVDRIISLKLLDKSLTRDNTALKRFVQEAEAAAKLNHPNLVPVYGNGITDAGDAYLLMEYVPGESLAQVIEREGALEEDRAISIFIQICEAMSYAHEKNILHRDIKPGNVILSKTESGEEIARLVDFGIAKTLPNADRETRDLTQTGEVFGSPHYMSPEQCLGFMVDQRSDIYSFGCLIWETLSGKTPFSGSNPIQLVVSHINDPVKPFLGKFGGNPKMKSLQAVALRCLEKQQIDRFQDFDEIAELLDSVSKGKRVTGSRVKHSTFSKQVMPLAFMMPGMVLLGLVMSFIIPTNFDYKLAGACFALLFLSPFCLLVYVMTSSFFECKKIVRNDLASRKHWWMTISLLLSAFIIGGIVPSYTFSIVKTYHTMDQFQLPAIFKYADVLSCSGLLIAAIATIASIVCLFGYLIDRSPRNVRMSAVAIKTAVFTMLATTGIFVMFNSGIIKTAAEVSNNYATQPKELNSGFGLAALEYFHKLKPDDVFITQKLAWAELKNEKYDHAIDLYTDLIKTKPKDKFVLIGYHDRRASAYMKTKKFQKAIEDYTEIIKREPRMSEIHTDRAEAYTKLNQIDKAFADYNKETELRPWSSEPYYKRAKLHIKTKDYEKAIANYNERMKLEWGQRPLAYACKAFAEELAGKTSEAQKNYKASLNTSEAGKEVDYYDYLVRAVVYAKIGEKDKAILEYKKGKTKNGFTIKRAQESLTFYPDGLIKPFLELIPELK